MADQDDIRHEQDDSADGMINNEIIEEIENLEDLTTLFAVRTTINQESNILDRFSFDLKS